METFNLVNPTQAHTLLKKVWASIKVKLAEGERLVLTLCTYEETMTARQRKYYHGYVLKQIALQARYHGHQLKLADWKEHYRETLLGDEVKTIFNFETMEYEKVERRRSTESLSVRQYNKLIEAVTADAATEYGVQFHIEFDEWDDDEQF